MQFKINIMIKPIKSLIVFSSDFSVKTVFLLYTVFIAFPPVRLPLCTTGIPDIGTLVIVDDPMDGATPPAHDGIISSDDSMLEESMREEQVGFSYPEHSGQGKF